MKKHKRSQYYVDRSVQSVLLARAVLYWAFCIIMLTLIMVCWRILAGPARPLHVHLDYLWFHYKPAMIASALLLPLIILDVLRVSNRFAGPMLRIRSAMKRLADGESNVAPLHFREKDFWKDLADSFNVVLARLNASTDADPSEPESAALEVETRDNIGGGTETVEEELATAGSV